MAKRYSAGRIFLQVVPSFKNLQNDINREVNKANRPLEKVHEEQGKRNEQARARGESKERERSAAQQLKDDARHESARLAQFQRFSQMVIGERVKEAKRREDVARRNAKSLFDLQQRTAAGQIKEDQRAAREREAMARRNAKNLFDLQQQIFKNQQRLDAEQERERRRLAKLNLNNEIRDLARAARERQRIEDDARRDAERKEARDEAKRAQIRRRRAGERLAGLRAEERERRRLAGGGAGSMTRKAAQGAADSIGVMRIDADSSQAERKLAALRERLLKLSDTDIGVDMNTGEAIAEIKLVQTELNHLARKSPDVHVEVNAKLAMLQLKRLEEQIDQINRKKATSGFLGMFGGATAGADDGANSFRIFNYRVLGLLVLLPTLAPLLSSAAAALGAIGTTAIGGAAGLGVMIFGFTGLGDAISALGDVQKNSAKDTLANDKAIRTASKGVRDAEQGVADARRRGARAAEDAARRVTDARQRVADAEKETARAIRDALRAQRDAERNLADAQRDATRAQQDLAAARKQAQRDQQDLADQIASGKLDERQALIDLFDAQVAYNAAMADGGATNLEREQASIQLERARLAIKGIRKENADLAEQQKKGADADGKVADAQQRVADTQQRVQDAQQAVIDAEERTRDARVDGARRIAEAQQGVADAIQAQSDAATDSAIAIRDANERLTDAQAAYQEALTKTGDIGSASMQKLHDAMSKLGPEGQDFARFIFGLQGMFYELRDIVQAGMLPPLQKEIQNLIDTYGPAFKDFLGTMGKTVGLFFTTFGDALRSPEMKSFFDTMAQYAPIFFTQFGDLFINIMKIVAGLAKAFAPFAKDFMDGLVGITDKWADWADSLAGSKGFNDFIDYVKREGPKVLKLIGDIVTLIFNIGKGMSETPIFDTITGFFSFLASLDPSVVAVVFTVFTGLAFASQVAAGVNALAISIGFLMKSALGPWVLGLMALAAGLTWAYNNVGWFHDAVDAIGRFFRDTFLPRFLEGWDQIYAAVEFVVIWFRDTFIPRFMEGWRQLVAGADWVWGYLEGAWNTVGRPLFDIIAKVFTGDFVGAWETAVTMVSSIWDKLLQAFKTPINWVINSVLNEPLFSGINSILDFLGIDARIPTIMPITTPAPEGSGFKASRAKNKYAFAEGGVFPGYTPGRDVHTFYSPTLGRLDVSGGEAFMRPEFTRAVGGQAGVDALNDAARKGLLPWQRFANGGVLAGMVKPVNVQPRFPWGHYPSGKVHRALDLAAPAGTPIVSPFSGTVIRDGWDSTGFGNHVRLAADNGSYWILGHMLREIVSVGQRLLGGQLMGYVGSTGHSTGNHLHLEGRTSPYDPATAFNFTSAFNGGVTRTPPAGADGTANLPWWADKPIEFARDLTNKAVGAISTKGIFGDMLRGLPNKIFDGARSFLAALLGSGDADLDSTHGVGGKFIWNGQEVDDNGAQMFDRGGLLQPGVTQVLNMTGKPEPVFTADQWAQRGGAGGRAPLVGHLDVDVNGSGVTAGDVADEIMWRVRRIEHGGKYAGSI